MNAQFSTCKFSMKTSLTFLLLMMMALLLTACATLSPFGAVEELTFQSGEFKVVGDLRLPAGSGPFPVVLFVHGDGPVDRTGMLTYLPIMERMLQAGFATFAWDKPGTGKSTGELNEPNLRHQRAQILLDAIELMKTRPEIDPARIGAWGASQAGYVIPIALTQTQDIAFVICVSCPGDSGHDQMVFQVTAFGLCEDLSKENSAEVERLLKELDQNRSFETYAGYLDYRKSMADLAALIPVSLDNWPVTPEQDWLSNPIEDEDVWNPVAAVRQVNMPILAIFGEQDRNMDSLQATLSYRNALGETGNPKSQVEVFPKADHILLTSKTGCPAELQKTVSRVFLWFAITHGLTSQEKIMEYIFNDPYKPGLLDSIPYAPGYLDLTENWLRNLYAEGQ